MLRHYEVSLAGPSHNDRGIPCQDAYALATCEGALVAAVADGLGSESRSDVGARIAARTAVDTCAAGLATCESAENRLAFIRTAYHAAYDAVLDEAVRLGESPSQMDCTLCLAVFDGSTVAFGQSGDSGLVAARTDGTYEVLTRMQRDEEGRVYPLCFDERWEFGTVRDVATVMLCTDGVLEDLIAPPILARHADAPVDTRLARGFLHPAAKGAEGAKALRTEAEAYLASFPRELLDDDKTVVVLFDDERPPADAPAPYYDGPDWQAVCAKAQAALDAAQASTPNAPEAAQVAKPGTPVAGTEPKEAIES